MSSTMVTRASIGPPSVRLAQSCQTNVKATRACHPPPPKNPPPLKHPPQHAYHSSTCPSRNAEHRIQERPTSILQDLKRQTHAQLLAVALGCAAKQISQAIVNVRGAGWRMAMGCGSKKRLLSVVAAMATILRHTPKRVHIAVIVLHVQSPQHQKSPLPLTPPLDLSLVGGLPSSRKTSCPMLSLPP